jgi:hypothetical protein
MDEVFTKGNNEQRVLFMYGKLWGKYGKQISKSNYKVKTLLCVIIRLLTYNTPF